MDNEIEQLERIRATWEWTLDDARDRIIELTTQIECLKRSDGK